MNGRCIIVPDLHAPFHLERPWNALLEIIDVTKPTWVQNLGDFADLYALNGHGKEFGRRFDFDREHAAVKHEWARLEEACHSSELGLNIGNHETRLTRLVAKYAPEIESLIPGWAEFFETSEDVVITPYQEERKIGRVIYVHDAGYAGANAARQTLAAINHNCVFGHTHRGTVAYSGDTDGRQRFALNAGYLGNEKLMTYVPPSKRREWQLGFGVVDYVDGLAFAQFVPWVQNRFYLDGKVWR